MRQQQWHEGVRSYWIPAFGGVRKRPLANATVKHGRGRKAHVAHVAKNDPRGGDATRGADKESLKKKTRTSTHVEPGSVFL
jgi:hypothetical protein